MEKNPSPENRIKNRDKLRRENTCAAYPGRMMPPIGEVSMLTCYLRYILDPYKLEEFEHYAKLWIPLVERFGGQHHGYFLPSEGANNVALALFSFPSLTLYEQYRTQSLQDADCQAAFQYARDTRCILSYERSFFRPLLA
jgi:hypothetical protein